MGLPACLTALVITAAVSIRNKRNPLRLAKEISWGTLVLVAGLFVIVDAVESIGALKLTQSWLAAAERLAPAPAAMLVSFMVAVANNLINNLPLGLIAGGTLHTAHAKGLIATRSLSVLISARTCRSPVPLRRFFGCLRCERRSSM